MAEEMTLGEEGLPKDRLSHCLRKRKSQSPEDAESETSGRRAQEEAVLKNVAESFTLGDVDSLIAQAQASADQVQGRQDESVADSQILHVGLKEADEGSQSLMMSGSQAWRKDVALLVAEFLRARQPIRVGQLGSLIEGVLPIVSDKTSCRPQPTAGGKSIFPLPVAGHHLLTGESGAFLRGLISSLNNMHGVPDGVKPNPSSARVVKRLGDILRESVLLKEDLPMMDFNEFFNSRGVDYQGDEIRLARKLTWASIEPSLPSQVGTLDLRSFCSGGVLDFVLNFENYLVAEEDQTLGRPPLTMVDPEEWATVARGLVERGICQIM